MATATITIENDADFATTVAYRTAPSPDGSAIDITGATMKMMVRKRAVDAAVLLSLSTDEGGGIVITDSSNGKFSIYIAQQDLERLSGGSYVHSLIMTLSGLKIRIWSGTMTITTGPTR